MGINYVPKKADGSNVIRDKNGVVIKVITEWNGKEVPFIFKGGRALKENKKGSIVPREHFYGMRRQAKAIHLKSLKKVPLRKRSIHSQHWEKTERERLSVLENLWCFIMPDGSVTIVRMDIDQDSGILKEVEMSYPDIDAAIRAQDHNLEKYFGGEKPGELNKLQFNRDALGDTLVFLLSQSTTEEKNLPAQKRLLAKIRKELQNCRNPFKVATREQIGKITKMKDSLGRKNPGALAARTTAADKNLDKRQKEISGIAGFTASRKHVLFFERKQIELNVASIIFRLEAMTRSSDKFFQNKEAFSKRLNEIMFLLQSFWVEPFFTPATEIRKIVLASKKQSPAASRQSLKTAIAFLRKLIP